VNEGTYQPAEGHTQGRRRGLLDAFSQHRRPADAALQALPGYLCEVCLDAPAVTMAPALGGGEMGVCAQCRPGAQTP